MRTAADTGTTAPIVTVSKPVVEEVVEWDEYTGRLEAVDTVDVRARVSGYLESIHFKDGQMVKNGDLLFVIDRDPIGQSWTGLWPVKNLKSPPFSCGERPPSREAPPERAGNFGRRGRHQGFRRAGSSCISRDGAG
ncbi:biotin/lipoyl-binding protein [Candidatus Kuenenia stuttgartensis]|uniref:biotin/lipoyl-binding protein n=1 Tax=Kuenenia stuttgartiensis TaxID=174633 RepID=UPI003B967C5E